MRRETAQLERNMSVSCFNWCILHLYPDIHRPLASYYYWLCHIFITSRNGAGTHLKYCYYWCTLIMYVAFCSIHFCTHSLTATNTRAMKVYMKRKFSNSATTHNIFYVHLFIENLTHTSTNTICKTRHRSREKATAYRTLDKGRKAAYIPRQWAQTRSGTSIYAACLS